MNARERILVHQRFVALQDAARAREAEALEAMTQAVIASSNPHSMDWGDKAEVARVEAVVYRALLDAEAIATGECCAVPVKQKAAAR